MASEIETEEPIPPARWPRRLAIVLGSVLVLLVALYFVASSAAFLKGFILPRVSQSLGAEITVADASIKPFSEFTLRKLVVKTIGGEPLATAEEVRVRYSLISILRGTLEIHELTLVSPDLRVIQEPDGKSNLDPILTANRQTRSAPETKPEPRLALRNVTLKNARLRLTEKNAPGVSVTTELSDFTLALDRLQNGQSGKLTLDSTLKLTHAGASTSSPAASGSLEAKLEGSFDFAVDPKLVPQEVRGRWQFSAAGASGTYAEFSGLSAVLQTDLTPTELRQFALRFERNGQRLGQVLISGPFDLLKTEARLKVEVQSIDRQVLNLIGATRGWDFGASVVNATSVVDLSRDWTFIAANGKITGRQWSFRQAQQATPALDVDLEYQAQVNLTAKAAVLQKLNLLARRGQTEHIKASLDRPMSLSWAANGRGLTDSTLHLALRELDLGDWRAVLGTNVPPGRADLDLNVSAHKGATTLTASLTNKLQNFTARVGTNRIDQLTATIEAHGSLEDFRFVDARTLRIRVEHQGQPWLRGNGSGRYDLRHQEITTQLSADAVLPRTLQLLPVAAAQASNGLLRVSSTYHRKGDQHTAEGSVTLRDLDGSYEAFDFQNFHTAFDFSLGWSGRTLLLRRGVVKFQHGFSSGGSVDLSGKADLSDRSGQLAFKAIEINQNALRPFLAPALRLGKIVSVSLNADGTFTHATEGDSALKGDFQLSNFAVENSPQKPSGAPLTLRLRLDGGVRQELLELRQCAVALTPTPRAQNQMTLQAKFDLKRTNASPGQVRLAAESVDLTPYYDLFASQTNAASSAEPEAQAAPMKGRQPFPSPFDHFTAEAKLDRLFLREMAVTNLLATANVRSNQITLDSLKLSLNGAPVNASGAWRTQDTGYSYDVSLQASNVVLEPIANSFSTASPGSLKGDLSTSAQIKGFGASGRGSHQNLSGQVALTVTNMNWEIVSPKSRRLLEPIAVVLGLNEVLQSPLSWIDTKTTFEPGRIQLDKWAVLSSAFYAETQGTIPVADVFTNSPLNLPLHFALRRSLAEQANLVPFGAPAEAAYVALPNFATVTGTLGRPKTDTDKLAIAGLVARSATRFVPGAGEAVGTVLEGLGRLLRGQSIPRINAPTNSTTSPPQKTNAPAGTNSTPGTKP